MLHHKPGRTAFVEQVSLDILQRNRILQSRQGGNVYYEEAVINGVLHSRGDPKGTWVMCSPEAITQAYSRLQQVCNDQKETIAVLESRMQAIEVLARPLQREADTPIR